MRRRLTKTIMTVLGLFLLSGMTIVSMSLPVSSQTKKKGTSTRKNAAKKTSAKKTTVKKPVTKSSGSTSTRKATTKSSTKRTLASSGRNTTRRATAGAAVRRSARGVRKTIGNSLSFMNQLSDNSTVQEQECISRYVECMDNQISSTISKYNFLADDEALNVALDTGQPFRCAFYDDTSVLLKTDKNLLNDDKSVCINSDANNCYTQKGVNELYSSYNYYCDINRKLKNNIGRKINQCDLAYASTFATKYSIAYYDEVLKRLYGDGLQMINLESSTIYKNFLSQLNLKNIDNYIIDSDISNEILNELSLGTETELFSVNVVPPIGANNYLASSQFNTATKKCFSTQEATGTKAEKAAIVSRNIIADYLNTNCASLKNNMERYYLTGRWEGVSLDSDGKQINGSETDIETDFFSAKESCSLYEQALVSVRDAKYGEFDNQMQNWIEDNIAKMVKKKIKTTSALSSAENSLIALDQSITLEQEKTAREISYNKKKAEGELSIATTKSNIAKQEAQRQNTQSNLELAKLYSSNYSQKAISACGEMIKASYDNICGSDGSKCLSNTLTSTSFYDWTSSIGGMGIKLTVNGNIVKSTDADYDKYVPTKANSADKTKEEGYYSISCSQMDAFNYTNPFFNSVINTAKNISESAGIAVEEELKKLYPKKG